ELVRVPEPLRDQLTRDQVWLQLAQPGLDQVGHVVHAQRLELDHLTADDLLLERVDARLDARLSKQSHRVEAKLRQVDQGAFDEHRQYEAAVVPLDVRWALIELVLVRTWARIVPLGGRTYQLVDQR